MFISLQAFMYLTTFDFFNISSIRSGMAVIEIKNKLNENKKSSRNENKKL